MAEKERRLFAEQQTHTHNKINLSTLHSQEIVRLDVPQYHSFCVTLRHCSQHVSYDSVFLLCCLVVVCFQHNKCAQYCCCSLPAQKEQSRTEQNNTDNNNKHTSPPLPRLVLSSHHRPAAVVCAPTNCHQTPALTRDPHSPFFEVTLFRLSSHSSVTVKVQSKSHVTTYVILIRLHQMNDVEGLTHVTRDIDLLLLMLVLLLISSVLSSPLPSSLLCVYYVCSCPCSSSTKHTLNTLLKTQYNNKQTTNLVKHARHKCRVQVIPLTKLLWDALHCVFLSAPQVARDVHNTKGARAFVLSCSKDVRCVIKRVYG